MIDRAICAAICFAAATRPWKRAALNHIDSLQKKVAAVCLAIPPIPKNAGDERWRQRAILLSRAMMEEKIPRWSQKVLDEIGRTADSVLKQGEDEKVLVRVVATARPPVHQGGCSDAGMNGWFARLEHAARTMPDAGRWQSLAGTELQKAVGATREINV